MKTIRTRFAPSPTGFMHVGNLRSALYAYLYAKQNQGEFILRIEDTDFDRFVEGAVEVIYSTLKAAGITFDEGPNEGGPCGPYVQSQRKAVYWQHAQQLIKNRSAYYCFCTKERLDSLSDGIGIKKYDKHCLSLTEDEVQTKLDNGEKFVIRQNIPTTGISEFDDLVFGRVRIENKELEDNVLLKSDGMPTYNFANVVDDHLMSITHVIRGNEYLSSTPKYNLLYQAFGWDLPEYMHLTPIMKDETRKLSKRYGDANFDDFVKKGYIPHAIVNYIALLGWSPKENKEKFTMEELIDKFHVQGLSRSSSIFDEVKMRWLNGEYIKEMDLDMFMTFALPYFEQSAVKGLYDYQKLAKLLQTRIEIFSEIPEKINFLAHFVTFDLSLYENKKFKINLPLAKIIVAKSIDIWNNMIQWNEDALHQSIGQMAVQLECKPAQVYTVLRTALTGVSVTPGGTVEMADILGKDESLNRLNLSLLWLE